MDFLGQVSKTTKKSGQIDTSVVHPCLFSHSSSLNPSQDAWLWVSDKSCSASSTMLSRASGPIARSLLAEARGQAVVKFPVFRTVEMCGDAAPLKGCQDCILWKSRPSLEHEAYNIWCDGWNLNTCNLKCKQGPRGNLAHWFLDHDDELVVWRCQLLHRGRSSVHDECILCWPATLFVYLAMWSMRTMVWSMLLILKL